MWLDVFTEMRKKSGMSIDEISAKSGVPKGTLSKISAGITKAPPLETMRKLVYAMGYTLDDLDESLSTKKSPSTAEAAPGEGPLSPPGYSFLSPANKIIADQIVEVLLKNQPQSVIAFPVNSVAFGGAEPKTKLDSEINLPEGGVHGMPGKDTAGTDDKPTSPEER